MNSPRTYTSAAGFRAALEGRLNKLAVEEGIDLKRVRRQVAFDCLLRRLFASANAPWLLKGGYAMELRIKAARTTRDVDLALMRLPVPSSGWEGNVGIILEMLREAGRMAPGDFFSFLVGEAVQDLDAAPYGGARFPIDARLAGRSPILLTERTSQVDEFAKRLGGLVNHVIVLKGGMGARQRRAVAEKLVSIPDGEERVLLATGRYIGEGFDDARLDTLFLAMPISWRGTLQQYVGRLHRLHDAKREVIVYDYVDGCIPMLCAMYDKRVRGYEAVGYTIRDDLMEEPASEFQPR